RLDVEVHAGKARAPSSFHFSAGVEAVDEQVGVVYEPFVARTNLDGANVTRGCNVRRKNEVPEHVKSAGGQGEGLGSFQNQVGCAKLPPVGELRRRRSLGRIPFGSAGVYPIGDLFDLVVAET